MRGGTADSTDSSTQSVISIHPPHAGRDLGHPAAGCNEGHISIHPPHAGRDVFVLLRKG